MYKVLKLNIHEATLQITLSYLKKAKRRLINNAYFSFTLISVQIKQKCHTYNYKKMKQNEFKEIYNYFYNGKI